MRRTAFAVALLVLCPLLAHAEPTTITHVSVQVGRHIFTPEAVGWQFPVTLQGGQSLVLTQNFQGPANDTTSYSFAAANYADESQPVIFLATDRWHIIYDYRETLTGRWSSTPNKATEWAYAYTAGNLNVEFGYADNYHPEPCLVARCFPEGFFSPTFFQGAFGYLPAATVYRPWDHCGYGAPTCVNSAAIRLTNTDPHDPVPPEHGSASLLCLFGATLFGAVAVRRR